jgi:hypothetical protein
MKKFSNFIIEAKASQQAKKLGLVSNGHGGWYNAQGEFVAKTENGILKFYNKGEIAGERDRPPKQNVPTGGTSPLARRQDQVDPNKEGMPGDGEYLTVVLARFNPPTKEHKQLFTVAEKVSKGGEIKIYPSRVQDSKQNPLDPNKKIHYMMKMFPKISEIIVDNPDIKTVFDVLLAANKRGYSNINIVVDLNRISEIRRLASIHNGQMYQFDDINVIPTGTFDSEKNSKGISSGMLRKTAADNNFNEFKLGMPKTIKDTVAKMLFNDLRKAMGFSQSTNESYNLWEISPDLDYTNLRENYIANKIFKIDSIVENLNTGLIGKVIRRGINYLICVTEDNLMFKSWIKDVIEKKEIENPSRDLKKLVKKAVDRQDTNIDGFVDKNDKKSGPYGAFIPQEKNFGKKLKTESKRFTENSGVPASKREVGTDSYRKYSMKMTNSEKIINFINKYKKKTAR